MYVIMSCGQNAGQSHNMDIGNTWFEYMAKFTHVGKGLRNGNCIYGEIRKGFSWGVPAVNRCRVSCLSVC
jgi:hypothetical protein